MSYGIALAGGGARGAAHVGVLLALEEEKLLPHSIAGTSAGGLVAGLYAAGVTPKMMKNIILELAENSGYLIDPDLLGVARTIPQLAIKHNMTLSGILKGNKMERYLYEKTEGKSMREAVLRTIIPAVDIVSGDTIAFTNSTDNLPLLQNVQWKSDVLLSEAMRASSAYPAVFRPKILDGMCLVDGGVTDVLPVDLLIAAGEKNVLAVDVGKEYVPPKSDNLFEVSTHSLGIMSIRLKGYHSHGEKLLLEPTLPEKAGLLTMDQMQECMEAGYNAVRTHMSFIRSLFG